MKFQRTLAQQVRIFRYWSSYGRRVCCDIKPAPADSGIHIVRGDLSGRPSLKALAENVKATSQATTLGSDIFTVSTVEHCLSAVMAHQIDNLIIDIEGPEMPILDGSAWVF